MPRIARVVVPGYPHHVTHRGNRRAPIFLDDSDRWRYLALIETSARECDLKVWAYALMGNHVHLIVVPKHCDSIARAVGNAHRKHAAIVNWRAGWTGHLWAHRFYSTPLDEDHLWAAVRYVELNPVRSGIVSDPCAFPWSSAAVHARSTKSSLLDPAWPPAGAIPDWERWLREGLGDTRDGTIRRATRTGRPAGTEEFIRELEANTGRTLLLRKRGRKSPPGASAG